MSFTEHEMHGLIAGKCVAGDMKVNEELPAYLVRKMQELESERDMYRNAEMSWEKAMMSAIGEDGTGSVTKAISDLKAERGALAAKLSRYSMSAGEADQRFCESRAVRVALGFGADAEDVAPVDLTDKINALAAENKVLDSAIGAIADAYETGLKDLLAQEIDTAVTTTTPATDAYANQLRAEGAASVGTLIRACAHEFPDSAEDIVEECAMIADNRAINLRKENANG